MSKTCIHDMVMVMGSYDREPIDAFTPTTVICEACGKKWAVVTAAEMARVQRYEQALRATGPCTPYRMVGTECCQHGYKPDRCPIRVALEEG